MSDSTDSASGLEALAQSLPTKPVTFYEYGWASYEAGPVWLQAFYCWCLAREREEADAENAAWDAANVLEQEPAMPIRRCAMLPLPTPTEIDEALAGFEYGEVHTNHSSDQARLATQTLKWLRAVRDAVRAQNQEPPCPLPAAHC